MHIKPIIVGVRQKTLLQEEIDFLKIYNPLGVILFSRNIDNPEQITELTSNIRKILGRPDAPIFLDQEGGRVARLKEPHWIKPPAASLFGQIAEVNLHDAKQAAYLNGQIIGSDLIAAGFNVDCAPVIDIPIKGAHSVIGNRAFSTNKEFVAILGNEMARGLMSAGVVPIIKHIPGHGRGLVDSHLELPVVKADYSDLKNNDFYPFKELNYLPMAMTAHIIYNSIDPENPATTSKKVIDVIREEINFNGLLVSDCITMKALNGTMAERAEKSFDAGVDIVIFSHGSIEEMHEVASHSPNMNQSQLDLLKKAYHQASRHYHFKARSELQGELMILIDKYNLSEVTGNIFDPTEQF